MINPPPIGLSGRMKRVTEHHGASDSLGAFFCQDMGSNPPTHGFTTNEKRLARIAGIQHLIDTVAPGPQEGLHTIRRALPSILAAIYHIRKLEATNPEPRRDQRRRYPVHGIAVHGRAAP